MGTPFEVSFRLLKALCAMSVEGQVTDLFAQGLDLTVWLNGCEVAGQKLHPGPFTIDVPASRPEGEILRLAITANSSVSPKQAGISPDTRSLVALLSQIRLVAAS